MPLSLSYPTALYLAHAVQRNMVTKYKVSGFVLDQGFGSTAILP